MSDKHERPEATFTEYLDEAKNQTEPEDYDYVNWETFTLDLIAGRGNAYEDYNLYCDYCAHCFDDGHQQ